MSSAQLGLLDSIVCGEERLCEGEIYYLEHRRKVSTLCLLYKIYHRAGHLINEYLNHFVAFRNVIASSALGELALAIPRCRTDQFSRVFLPATVKPADIGRASWWHLELF